MPDNDRAVAAPARTPRAASLQLRLSLAVGVLALAAIVLVALAARRETRLEFLRLADVQRREASAQLPALAARLAGELDGRCCTGVAGLSSQLPPGVALLILDARDALLASAGPAAAP